MGPVAEHIKENNICCKNCDYLDTISKGNGIPGEKKNICRISPPRVIAVTVDGSVTSWPTIYNPDTDWCSSHSDLIDVY